MDYHGDMKLLLPLTIYFLPQRYIQKSLQSIQNREVFRHVMCFELKHEAKLFSMMHDDFVKM